MEITCMLIPNYFFQLHETRDPQINGKSVIIGDRFSGVMGFSPEAASLGISYGLSLNDALALSPNATLIKPEYEYYEEQWNKTIGVLTEYALVVEDGGFGCAYMKLNIEKYKEYLDSIFFKQLNINWGVSNGKFPAFVAALYASDNNFCKATSNLPDFLSSISIDVLPIGLDTKNKLLSFGMSLLGDIATQNLAPMEAQFGSTGRLIWSLSRGIDTNVLTPVAHPLVIEKTINFDYPNNDFSMLQLALYQVIKLAYLDNRLKGRFVRSARLKAHVYEDSIHVVDVPFRRALGNYEKIFFITKMVLDRMDFTGPVESLSVEFRGITGEFGIQNSLFENLKNRANLNESISQLAVISGNKVPIYKIKEVDKCSKHPEERYLLVEYDK